MAHGRNVELIGALVALLCSLMVVGSYGGFLGVEGGSLSTPPARIISSQASFYASPNPDDVNTATTFYASGLCGGACTYDYSGLPSGCSSSNTASLSCVPSASGEYSVTASAVWACSLVCLSNSGTITLTVNAQLLPSEGLASPDPTDVGHPTTLEEVTTGGTPPLSYTWSDLPPGCATADTSELPCTPDAAGTYSSISVYIVDAIGVGIYGGVYLVVNSDPTIQSLSINPSITDLGGGVTFAVSESGGTTPFTYSYSNLPPGCASVDASGFGCTPTTTGTWDVGVSVVDAVGESAYASTDLTVHSAETLYAVTFVANGLPAGTDWTVNLGQTSEASMTSSIFFPGLENGSYPFNVDELPNYSALPSSGTVSVTGADRTEDITFKANSTGKYSVNFTEVGLPSATVWEVTLNGSMASSNGPTIAFSEPNGTYDYTVIDLPGYVANQAAGSVNVNGANSEVAVRFAPGETGITYSVTFVEAGLPDGTMWSVTLDGLPKNSTTASITFPGMADGNYNWSVGPNGGFASNPASGMVHLSDGNIDIGIAFSQDSTSSNPGFLGFPGNSGGYLIAILAAAALVAIVASVTLFRRPGRAPPKTLIEPAQPGTKGPPTSP
jgi:hypothetical protein